MATPVPIPPDLWRRLAALDARCDFSLVRRDANAAPHRHTSGKNYRREWEVTIGERGDPRGPMIVQGASLRQVLEAAVADAEQRGWDRSAPAAKSAGQRFLVWNEAAT